MLYYGLAGVWEGPAGGRRPGGGVLIQIGKI